MPLDLATATRKLDLWLEAEEALAVSQSYTINQGGISQQITRADLSEVAKRIDYWQAKVNQLSGASRVRHVVPL